MCYAHSAKELAKFKEGIRADGRATAGDPQPGGGAKPSDFLLAEQNGEALGTATSLPMAMWVRGSRISCQGIAYVGVIKSHRRRAGAVAGENPGIASQVMFEMLRAAREREFVVSALMPFRVSFYEHFGYGIVERRTEWTIPLSILPTDPPGDWRLLRPDDKAAQALARQRMVELGQCDIERSPAAFEFYRTGQESGMLFGDAAFDSAGPAASGTGAPAIGAAAKGDSAKAAVGAGNLAVAGNGGAVSSLSASLAPPGMRAWCYVEQQSVNGKDLLKVLDWTADSMGSFRRLLAFFGTMRDQFSSISITVPADWHLNRLLTEPQLPHRPVNHVTAQRQTNTRMQMRILNHAKFLESLTLPTWVKGKVGVAVHEIEGGVSRFGLEINGGKAGVVSSAGAVDFECPDRHWAAIASGDLSATEAVQLGLAEEHTPGAAITLGALSVGPPPFCQEWF
jgi:predicted acetyltransferase